LEKNSLKKSNLNFFLEGISFKHVIIGNGIAGAHAAATIRRESPDCTIEIYSDEEYTTYSRPKLPQYLGESIRFDDLFIRTQDWYDNTKIFLQLKTRVVKIDPHEKQIFLENGGSTNYDRLLIATGSHSFMPPIKGSNNPKVRTLRTLNDARELIDLVEECRHVAVIGGGLLGIETANAVRNKDIDVTIIEFFPRLLPRQLDIEGAGILKKIIESRGIKIVLGVVTEEIQEVNGSLKNRLNDSTEIHADLVIVSAGVRPSIELAKNAGIKTNRGIIVNEYMETSEPSIYAAGDVAEFNNTCWCIIPAAYPQARTAAINMIHGRKEKVMDIIPSNTLKVADIDLTSIGTIYFEEKPENVLEYRIQDVENGIYKKITIQDNLVIGAILLGDNTNLQNIAKLIKMKINVEEFKEEILQPDFNLKKYQ